MSDPLYHLSSRVIRFTHVASAYSCFAVAMLFGIVILLLTGSFGLNWITVIINCVLGFWAAAFFVDGCQAYLSAKPLQSPDQRQRYFDSRSLYLPRPRNARRQLPGRDD